MNAGRHHLRIGSAQKARQRGLTLMEILVTLVVLAVGLLGIAGLHLAGMRSSFDGYLRTQAVNLAKETADRLRGNREGVRRGCYTQPAALLVIQGGTTNPPTQNCGAIPAAAGAQADINALDEYFNNRNAFLNFTPLLPSGSVTIDCATINIVCTITVAWDEGTRNIFGPQQYALQVRL